MEETQNKDHRHQDPLLLTYYISTKQLLSYAFSHGGVTITRMTKEEFQNRWNHHSHGFSTYANYIHKCFNAGLGEFEYDFSKEAQSKPYVCVCIHKGVLSMMALEKKHSIQDLHPEKWFTVDVVLDDMVINPAAVGYQRMPRRIPPGPWIIGNEINWEREE